MNDKGKIDQKQFLTLLNNRLAKLNKNIQPDEYIVCDERKVVYIVNSKVACSSIKAAFIDPTTPDDHNIHYIAAQKGLYKFHLTEEQTHYFKFSFVRNPFSRLVSCYESKYHIDPVKYNREDLKKYLFGYMAEDEGFEVFVRKVCALPPRLMDHHFRTQYDLLYDSNGVCRCDYIGQFESLEEDFAPIKERFGLYPLPHLNRSQEVNWRHYYTSETMRLVIKTYKKDFDTFGYACDLSL